LSSKQPISDNSLRIIADFGEGPAFKELFQALEAGFAEEWKASDKAEVREQLWFEMRAARLLAGRIEAITKKLKIT
jgi:hypothetical protein